jgi:hypothetical protein
MVLGVTALAAGIALLLDRTGAVHLTSTQLLAVPLAVLGAALAVGALVGRSWVAMTVGVLLTLVTLASVVVGGHFTDARDVTWTPATAGDVRGSYHLDVGRARLDLTHAGSLAGRHVTADVDAGRLEVVVPDATPVRIHADAGLGSLDLLGSRAGGVTPHRTTTRDGYTDAGGLDLDLHVRVGAVEVTHG